MDELQKFTDAMDKIPDYVKYSEKSISQAMDDNDLNLVKSLIVYEKYLKKTEKIFDNLLDDLSED
tara:strand:+ start:277 stop:471 length:195 start_codon:yes stop_codon:yes gene_type:complete